jgi:imidazolonepropionase-like amidohydrolase
MSDAMTRTGRAFTCAHLLFAVLPGALLHGSDAVPGAPQKRTIALVGATVCPVSRPAFRGTIVLDGGRITALGEAVEAPAGAEVIPVEGKRVYPGLFDAFTDLGLIEVSTIAGSLDSEELGELNPNVEAHVAVNPDSEHIPVTRSNGVLLALTSPTGGRLAGQAAVLQLDGWTWEDLTLRPGAGMYVELRGAGGGRRRGPPPPRGGEPEGRDRMERALETLRDFFEEARAYRAAREARGGSQPRDARLEAMLPVLAREQPLIARANLVEEIRAAAGFAVEQGVSLIIHGGYDAPLCAPLLRKHGIPVIVSGVYRLPARRSDPYDHAFTLPARLSEAGVEFCISSSGGRGASQVRNLPYHAAMAAAFGLAPDEALRAITLYPARILGVEPRVGSLDTGKDATLIVTDGDPLETRTTVEMAFVRGRKVDLTDRHKQLWAKYREKYRQLGEGGGEARF